MRCYYCGEEMPEGAVYCFRCGRQLLPVRDNAGDASDTPACGTPQGKKGTHWIPIAIMAVLCVLGLTLFFTMPYDAEVTDAPVSVSETPWFYNDNGTLYFHEALYEGPAELTIPDIVDGIPVTALGDGCFYGCDELTTVILPEGLTTIGKEAFFGCTAMRGIFIAEGVSRIGQNAFSNCLALEAICIPSTVETIGRDAFSGCISLSYILFNGTHETWNTLYREHIALGTEVYCTDGTFLHCK